MITYKTEINISEIIEHNLTNVEREQLVKYIFFDYMNHNSRKKFIKDMFNDFKETELEFDNSSDVLKALDTVIESIKYL